MLQIQASAVMDDGKVCHGLPIFNSTTSSGTHSPTSKRYPKQNRQHQTPCTTQAPSPIMTDDEVRILDDQSAPVITAPQTAETSPTMSQGSRSRHNETQRGTMASPRQDLALEFERQHRQYFPGTPHQQPQSAWSGQDVKFENGGEYPFSQIQTPELQPFRRSARIDNEYKEELSNNWTPDPQNCLHSIPWRPSHLPQDNFHRRTPLAYHSHNFGLSTTMADTTTSSDLSAYTVTVANLKPQYHTTEPSYTDLVTGSSVYPFQQSPSDGVSNSHLSAPGGDQVLAYSEEPDQVMLSGRESTMPPMEADLDPEDVEMCEDMTYDEKDSPSTMDPADEKEGLPYAKLIWKAFMSTPTKSMHLQQIYEWFRQNTNKTSGDGRGWMNSIRHNLSMNKAFIKQNSRPTVLNDDGTVSMDGNCVIDSRKSTEWVLDPKFYSGVKSTTRYRRPNGSNRSRGASSGHGKGARAAGGGGGAGMGAGVGGTEGGGGTSAASNARVSAGRRGGHVAAQNRKRNRAAEKQQQHQQAMAPMAAVRNVPHSIEYHHTAAMHPICDTQRLGKGAAAYAYVDQHLGYPYPTSSPFNTADFICGAGAGPLPATTGVTRYEQETSDGRLLGTNYFTSQHYHLGLEGGVSTKHNRTLATENDNISEPLTPPASAVDHYVGSGGHGHISKADNYLHDVEVTAIAASHDGYPTLTSATAAGYVGVQPRQQDNQQHHPHGAHAYVDGVYEPRTGELPPSIYWDGDVPLANLSLDS